MKLYSLSVQLSAVIALAFLSCGINNNCAACATVAQDTGESFSKSSPFEPVAWEQYKVEKLEHAYHLLEHADGDYGGHRVEAMHSIKKAAENLGVEFHGHEHAEESQWKSDRRLREARRLLEDLVVESGGKEQPHIHRAIKEIDRALATK
jgi:hypothetical protein